MKSVPTSQHSMSPAKSKARPKIGLIIFISLVVLACLCVGGLYFFQPKTASNEQLVAVTAALPLVEPTAEPEPTRTPIPEYPTLADFTPSLAIPYCDTLIANGDISNTYLCMVSEAGDFVGNGEKWLITPDEAEFSTMHWWDDGGGGTISVVGEDRWDLDFRAPEDTVLIPGIYEDAIRAMDALRSPNNGLAVSGAGRACGEISGKFEILEIVRGPNNELKSFAANFIQHCEGSRRLLAGYIRFNSQVP